MRKKFEESIRTSLGR